MAEITVTAKVTYVYDTDDGLVTDIDSALDDVHSMIDSGDLSAQDFEFQTEVQGVLSDEEVEAIQNEVEADEGGYHDEDDPHDDDGNRLTPPWREEWPEEIEHEYADYDSPTMLRDHLMEQHGYIPESANFVLYEQGLPGLELMHRNLHDEKGN